jgi:hypothetical protein
MKKQQLFALLLAQFMIGLPLIAQQKLPIIKANNDKASIRDGQVFKENNWRISPEIKPDVYATNKKGEKVSFYTDVDSISFTIQPDKVYDFIVLLRGKDSALTRIQYQTSYLDKLKAAAQYDFSDKTDIPKFTYQSSDNPNLIALRKGFNLDSIATLFHTMAIMKIRL